MEEEIERLLSKLRATDPSDPKYKIVLDSLVILNNIKTAKEAALLAEQRLSAQEHLELEQKMFARRVSAQETIFGINKGLLMQSALNMAGLVLILKYEELGVITTKAASLLPLLRR
jgi:hypothetical protein